MNRSPEAKAAIEALNTPATLPSVRVATGRGPGKFGTVRQPWGERIAFRRAPNWTGSGPHKFVARFTLDPDDGTDWNGTIEVFQMTPDGAAYPRFETAVRRSGRMLPDNQLPVIRAAAIEAYKLAFPWSDGAALPAWADREHGASAFVDSYGTWGRAATVDGKGFTYRGDVGDTEATLAFLVADIRAGVDYVNPDKPAARTPTVAQIEAAAYGMTEADIDAALDNPASELARLVAAENAAHGDMSAPVRTIDITPTWRAVAPIIEAGLTNGTAEGRRIAREELQRMADIADAAVAADKAARERFEADLAAAPAPVPADSAALLGPRERGNPADIFNMTEIEARAMVWAWGRLVPGLTATPATEELGGPHEAHMGYGLTIAGNPGQWLWVTRAAVAHAVALAKAVPSLAPAAAFDPAACLRNGHVLGRDGTCSACGMKL